MRTFIADIIPKIQKFSKKLDNLTLLTNQHWVVLDELGQSKTVYIFRQNNELLISTNGKVEKAQWEYLGQNSILIDLREQSYLFRHGFFDENILALKIDSKEEYAILVNETKYQGELNSISTVLKFLDKQYLVNPVFTGKSIDQPTKKIIEFKYEKKIYNLKMGSIEQYFIKFYNGQTTNIYKKISNGKFFIYELSQEIILFPSKEICLEYIQKMIR